MAKKPVDPNAPLAHKARMSFSHYAPDFTVYAIYRGESFAGIRGPGYFTLNPLTERLGEAVSTKLRAREFVIENLMTRDPVTFGLGGKISYFFDPREGDPVPISSLVKLSHETLNNVLGDAMQDFIFKAVRAPVNDYFFEEMQRGATLARLEALTVEALDKNPALKFLGIIRFSLTFTHVQLAQELANRLTEAAQRRYNAQAASELRQGDLLRSLIVELVEKVSRDGNLEQLFNFTDAVNTLRQVEATLPPPAPRGITPPASGQTIDGEAVVKPVETTPPSTPPPTSKTETPSGKSKSKNTRGKKPKSESYLDPDLG